MTRDIEISVGNGGWVRVDYDDAPGLVYLRFQPDERDRLQVREVYFAPGDAPVIGAHLAELPLANIAAEVNADDMNLREKLNTPSADLATLASYYAHTFGSQVPDDHWVKLSFESQIPGSRIGRVKATPGTALARPPRRRRLRRPEDGRITDEFLSEVAAAYRAEVRNNGPRGYADRLAAEANVTNHTIHKWVKIARQRGLLTAAGRGVAG